MDDRFLSLEKYNLWGGNTPQVGFIRKNYTEKIFSYAGNRLVKVLVGQRRAGKSYLLRQIVLRLVEGGVDKKNIFFGSHKAKSICLLMKFRILKVGSIWSILTRRII